MIRLREAALVAAFTLVALGCGPSAPEHTERPMAAPPARTASEFDRLTTPEAKIQYIQNSKAPDSEKKQAIAQIRSGKL